MKITIPKVVLQVDLVEYAPELAGRFLHVWVNPPKERLQAYDDLVTALQAKELEAAKKTLLGDDADVKPGDGGGGLTKVFAQVSHWLTIKKEHKGDGTDVKLLEWYAEIWSQGPEEARWTAGELREIEEQDPSFLSWMISQTWKVRTDHIQRKKKA